MGGRASEDLLHSEVLIRLLCEEYVSRIQAGESIDPEVFARQYPEISNRLLNQLSVYELRALNELTIDPYWLEVELRERAKTRKLFRGVLVSAATVMLVLSIVFGKQPSDRERAEQLMAEAEYEDAIRAWGRLPMSELSHVQLAQCFIATDDMNMASYHYEAAFNLTRNYKYLSLTAYCFQNLDQHTQALETYARIPDEHRDFVVYHNMAQSCLRLMKYDEAIPYLEEVINKNPDLSVSYACLAIAKYYVNNRDADHKTAVDLMTKAIDREPAEPYFHHLRAFFSGNREMFPKYHPLAFAIPPDDFPSEILPRKRIDYHGSNLDLIQL